MIKLLAFIMIANAYKLITNSFIERNPFYIYNNITPMHNDCIVSAINTFNNACSNIGVRVNTGGYITQQQIIDNPQYNTITYGSAPGQVAYTTLQGILMSDGNFLIKNIDIFINKEHVTNKIACYNMFLHELGHAHGLMHNEIKGSIMNASIAVDNNFNTVSIVDGKPIVPLKYHIDDVYGIWAYSQKN